MPVLVEKLKDRLQTGQRIKWVVKNFWQDIGDDINRTLPDFFDRVRKIPYYEDPEENDEEVVGRPSRLLDEREFPHGLDCKKKTILISSWLEGNGVPWRLIGQSEQQSGHIHHVFPQAKIDGEWYNVDATYPDYEIFEAKPETTNAEQLAGSGMNLVSLYGRPKLGAPQYQFSLFSMSGADAEHPFFKDPIVQIDPRDLTDVDAGIQALYVIAKLHPGIRWRDMLPENRLGKKWWEKVTEPFAAAVDWTGDKISAVGTQIGEWSGSSIRLATDEQVADGLGRYAAAAATGGMSEGANSLFDGGLSLDSVTSFLGNLGKKSKQQINQAQAGTLQIDQKTLMYGGIAGLFLLLLLKKR